MKYTTDLDYWFNTNRYDLVEEDIKQLAIFSAVVISLVGFGGIALFKEKKRVAWSISLVNSVVLTVASLTYQLGYVIPNNPGVLSFQPDVNLFHGRSNGGVVLIVWFALANILDLTFGLIFYRDKMDFLTSFIHHPVFIWMSYFAATGDGIFCSGRPFTPAYTMLFLVELPTMLLAIGSVFSSLRTDIGFGVTFFIFRLVYHAYFLALAFASEVDLPLKCCFVLPFFLHVFWFSSWVSKYARPKKDKDKKIAKD